MKHILSPIFLFAALASLAAPTGAFADPAPVAPKTSDAKPEAVVSVHEFLFKGNDSADYAVALKPDQDLSVTLADNGPSTGYAWFLTDADSKEELAARNEHGWKIADAKAGVLTLSGAPQFTPPPPRELGYTGEAGKLSWSFSAKKEGRQVLRFTFHRAWEKPSPRDRTVTYTVTVSNDATPGVKKITDVKKNADKAHDKDAR